jgi:hypothetical protein
VQGRHHLRAIADRSGDTFGRSRAYVADCEYAGRLVSNGLRMLAPVRTKPLSSSVTPERIAVEPCEFRIGYGVALADFHNVL